MDSSSFEGSVEEEVKGAEPLLLLGNCSIDTGG